MSCDAHRNGVRRRGTVSYLQMVGEMGVLRLQWSQGT